MIISVHIRKAAGTSFRKALAENYGEKLLLDYGDEIGSSRYSSKIKRLKSTMALHSKKEDIVDKYAIIHGHFFAKKYFNLNQTLQYATFLRNPVERVLSNYYYLKRKKDRKHGDAVVINKYGYSLEQYICHKDAKNVQSQFLSGLSLDKFSFVGLTEEYNKSILLFNKIFGANLSANHNENYNPLKKSQYIKSNDIIELIKQNNKKDMVIYEQGKEIFYKQCELLID